jgi:hypothetical protein
MHAYALRNKVTQYPKKQTQQYYISYLTIFTGVYILSGNPEHVVLGDNVTVTLTCIREDIRKYVGWAKDTIYIATIRKECEVNNGPDNTYTYTCDLVNNIYYLHISPDAITDGIQNVEWQCLPFTGSASNKWSLTLSGMYDSNDMMLHFRNR